ncbi:FAD-binding oxidoreductase [Actibacterium sp. 188UL27-1]|uniref:NAD(P)/FAD-dependent oxidoreductase n=1 Tax=Actibacterium sp. 188UL27-1 TaxID=2786961 RepID=UPI0019570657|nr:FAD-dependent oxidoreductase [Actibacterium sp. 188UL27-1]MBM7069485.1 FAD-dependent oxidoreductase [Actibacterium sp. 188UL27-1]
MTDVLVIGAGINGLSTAYWLTKSGLSVTVVERGRVPCPTASSSDHHRLIRPLYGDARGYTARIPAAYEAWRAMWSDLGPEARYYAETGMLALCQERGDYTDQSRATMDALGQPYEQIDSTAALDKRFPFLEPSNVAYGLLSEGGALMADVILTDLAAWLRRQGVSILEMSPVTQVDPVKATATLTSGEVLSAGQIIVAAGIGLPHLTPWLEVPLLFRRTVILYAQPPKDLTEIWANAPSWTHLGGTDNDLWGMPPLRGLPMKLGDGSMGREDPDDSDRTMTRDEMQHMRAGYAARFRRAEDFQICWGQANYWTKAPGAAFVMVRQDRAVALSACSGHGFKFGALTGRDASDAITGQAPVADIAHRMAGR